MSNNTLIPLPIIRFPVVRLLCTFICLISVHTSAHAQHPQSQPHQQPHQQPAQSIPTDLFAFIPDSADAAIVFNDPANQLFTSESGQSIHQLISKVGLFSRTRSAFDSLAQAFGSDSGQTINAVFSNRVLIAWEAKKNKENSTLMEFVQNMDTQWAMLCEIEPESIVRLKQHFEPKPRSIEQGCTLWAIEQGRYDLVILEPSNDTKALLLFSPRASKPLFESMLNQINAARNPVPAHRAPTQSPSLLDTAIPLQSTLSQMQPGAPWLAAWVIQSAHTSDHQPKPTQAIAGLLHLDTSALSITFTSNTPLDMPPGNAPVGLLGAIGDDAIMATALARTPTLTLSQNHLSTSLSFSASTNDSQSAQADPSISTNYAGGPGLFVLSSPTPNTPDQAPSQAVMTLMTWLGQPPTNTDESPAATPAERIDRLIEEMFIQIGTQSPPSYLGRFPSAIRTYTFEPSKDTHRQSDPTRGSSWPGDNPTISWLAHESQAEPSDAADFAVIAAIGPRGAPTSRSIEWIANAADNLSAINTSPDQQLQSAVLARGYIHPQRAFKLLGELTSMDSTIARFINTIEWDITRAPVGIQGHINLIFNRDPTPSQLGS